MFNTILIIIIFILFFLILKLIKEDLFTYSVSLLDMVIYHSSGLVFNLMIYPYNYELFFIRYVILTVLFTVIYYLLAGKIGEGDIIVFLILYIFSGNLFLFAINFCSASLLSVIYFAIRKSWFLYREEDMIRIKIPFISITNIIIFYLLAVKVFEFFFN